MIKKEIMLVVFGLLLSGTASADFTIVVLPDTQVYSESYPEIFLSQTEWIRDNAEKENIVFVIHEGDIVNQQNNQTQWENADKALKILDDAGIPYILSVGNHDMGSSDIEDANDRDTTTYNTYFPYTRFEDKEWYGGHMGNDNDNYYVLFSAEGIDFLILSLEFGPSSDILNWASRVMAGYPNRKIIIVTHSYMDSDGNRVSWNNALNPHKYGIEKEGIEWYEFRGVRYYTNESKVHYYFDYLKNLTNLNRKHSDDDAHYIGEKYNSSDVIRYYVNISAPFDGEEMWNALLKHQPNVFLILSGHSLGDGSSKLKSFGAGGNAVYQIVLNYQFLPDGGGGWLGLIKFKPDENRIEVRSYSPWLDLYKVHNKYRYNNEYQYPDFYLEEEHDFDIEYDMKSSSSGITGNVVGGKSGNKKEIIIMAWFLVVLGAIGLSINILKKRKDKTNPAD